MSNIRETRMYYVQKESEHTFIYHEKNGSFFTPTSSHCAIL